MAQEPSRDDLDALKQGAAMLLQSGNRIAALSLLWSAVAIDPTDLSSHRRLAATLANGGDLDGAADEFARYIEFVLPLGHLERAMDELSYGVQMLGGHQALRGAADRIADAVRALVPPAGTALGTGPLAAIAADVSARASAPPLPPRLLPKVPFRFCIHDAGGQRWMQLEGGNEDLTPEAVRLVDRYENVVDERLCIPLQRGEGHGSATPLLLPPLTWVVVRIPDHLAAAIDAGREWDHVLRARVSGEWLALDLIDTGCRLGARAASAS